MVRRQRLLFFVKLLVGIGLLGVLLVIDENWKKVIDLVTNIREIYLLPFLGISLPLIWISCVKWGLFINRSDRGVSIWKLMELYVIGYFFNNFFPTNFGGDTVRSYLLGRHLESQERALATVFLERFTGFIAMVTLAITSFLFIPELRDDMLIKWSVLTIGTLTLGVIVIIAKPSFIRWMLYPFRNVQIVRSFEERASKFHKYVVHFRREPGLLARAMVYSYIFYGFAALNVYFAALLLGVNIGLAPLFVLTPIVLLIAAVPLTPNSIGVWEWGFSVYLVSAGAAADQGLAIALALRGKTILTSILGGILFLFERGSSGRAEISKLPPTDDGHELKEEGAVVSK